jgi:hypothetical protein
VTLRHQQGGTAIDAKGMLKTQNIEDSVPALLAVLVEEGARQA